MRRSMSGIAEGTVLSVIGSSPSEMGRAVPEMTDPLLIESFVRRVMTEIAVLLVIDSSVRNKTCEGQNRARARIGSRKLPITRRFVGSLPITRRFVGSPNYDVHDDDSLKKIWKIFDIQRRIKK